MENSWCKIIQKHLPIWLLKVFPLSENYVCFWMWNYGSTKVPMKHNKFLHIHPIKMRKFTCKTSVTEINHPSCPHIVLLESSYSQSASIIFLIKAKLVSTTREVRDEFRRGGPDYTEDDSDKWGWTTLAMMPLPRHRTLIPFFVLYAMNTVTPWKHRMKNIQ